MEYKLIRSKRKTLTICITGGEIIVKSPPRISVEHIEKFLNEKSEWISKKLGEYAKKTSALSEVISGDVVLYHGQSHPIVPSDKHKRIAIDDGKLCLPIKYSTDKSSALRAVTAWFKRIAKVELEAALEKMSVETGLKYKSFALTNARTKWGSCDGDCDIRLNWRLVMLDGALVEYVLIHELAHTVHHDHSAQFWALVKSYAPDYSATKKRLKTYSVLTSLYR
ncbi:MAG: M48 family metallopeptidase [Clostridiales bacterium]|nr:M48 family metallopeptidase [Clostridiales bacterium]